MNSRLSVGTWVIAAGMTAAAILQGAEDKINKVFQLRGSNADGATYTGQVVMTKLSDHTGTLHWATGKNKDTTNGIGVRGDCSQVWHAHHQSYPQMAEYGPIVAAIEIARRRALAPGAAWAERRSYDARRRSRS